MRQVINRILVGILIIIMHTSFLNSQPYEATWEHLDQRPVPQWYKDSKFGIFIHWGLYSVPSWGPTGEMHVYSKYAEWYWKRLKDEQDPAHQVFRAFHDKTYGEEVKYQDFVHDFTAELFDPFEWAEVFRNSGARYVVLTSKHHEGFCLWPSEQSWNWNSMDAGPHRDLAGELITAVKETGLKMGFYYSLYEWFNPLYHQDINMYVDQHMIPQMKDLVTRYKPDIFWPDGEWDHISEKWKSEEFLAWLYNESPVKNNVVVNDRWGKETRGQHGGYYTTEYGLVHDQEQDPGDMAVHPWEECRGIGGSFGYNRNENVNDYMSAEELVHLLVDIVSKGGNLLLNIGPTADGRIPVIMEERLLQIGEWLKVNGRAIYRTEPWWKAPKMKEKGIHFTKKADRLYIISKNWPVDSIQIPELKLNKDYSIKMLGQDAPEVNYTYEKRLLTIEPPSWIPCKTSTGYAYVFEIRGVKW